MLESKFPTFVAVCLLQVGLATCCADPPVVVPEKLAIGNQEFMRFAAGTLQYRPTNYVPIATERREAEAVRVRVNSFLLAVHEVTVGDFRDFVTDTGYKSDAEAGKVKASSFESGPEKLKYVGGRATWDKPGFPQTEEHPVTCVTYADAEAYCQWFTKRFKHKVRLPTGVEWEYACRYGGNGEFDFESEAVADHVNLKDQALQRIDSRCKDPKFDDEFAFTCPVTAKKPGRSGLVLMHGNVSEWCQVAPDIDRGSLKNMALIRGGCWLDDLSEAGAETQLCGVRAGASSLTGFRLGGETTVSGG